MQKGIFIGNEGKTEIKYNKDGSIKLGFQGGDCLTGRILRPSEFIALQNILSKLDNVDRKGELTNLNCILLLGARYLECQRIQHNPEWFDGDFVTIKNTKQKAIEANGARRNIRLSSMGKTEMRHFFDINLHHKYLPTVSAYNEKLKRWAHLAGIDESHISVRMLRKTWESWLYICYPEYIGLIAKSQGHTQLTAFDYYIDAKFTDADIQQMRPFVEGWKPKDKGW
jgi:integrase